MFSVENTAPDRDANLSWAFLAFWPPHTGFDPKTTWTIRYKPHNTWHETLAAREESLRIRHMKDANYKRSMGQGHSDASQTSKPRMTQSPSRYESPVPSDKGQFHTPKRLSFRFILTHL